MFSTKEYVENKSALSGKGRFEYLQALVTEFQDTSKHGEMRLRHKISLLLLRDRLLYKIET